MRNIQDVYRIHKEELDAVDDKDKRHRLLVELNVREQCLNVMKLSFVQKRLYGDKDLQVHGWVYDLTDGNLNDMKITPDDLQPNLEIYRINMEA